jgi:CubicO group peptidase (beta-lactamase class C family)
MVIEDVKGEPFSDFMEKEVTKPLGMASLHWTWTPELIRQAAIPYIKNNQPVGYRQLACQAIGSEVGTVSDFARFIAAAVEGPNGESVGRGVLKSETVRQMLQAQLNTGGTAGLGYGLQSVFGERIAVHSGGNPGWSAIFWLDLLRREGFVLGSSSSNASPLESAIVMLWEQTVRMRGTFMWLLAILGLSLALSILWLRSQVRSGQRTKSSFKLRRIFIPLPWAILALLWGCLFYSSLLLPFAFPDAWPPQIHIIIAVLLVWIVFGSFVMLLPKTNSKSE